MTMKQILHCTLIFMVLVTSGCSFFSDESTSTSTPKANSSPTPPTQNTIDFSGAAINVRNAVKLLDSLAKTRPPATVTAVKNEINDAIEKLGEKERDRCISCTDATKKGAADASRSLTAITTSLGKDPQKEIAELDSSLKEDLKQQLTDQADNLDQLNKAEPKPTVNPAPSPAVASRETKETGTGDSDLSDILTLALKIVGGLLALVLIGYVLTYLWKSTWNTLELNVARIVTAHLAANREAPPDYSQNLSSLSSAQTETSSRLNELNTEVRNLARLVRESMAVRRTPSDGGFNYQTHVEPVQPKEEPEFPVSAGDYLGKMARFANVVRPDFQNGILVNDPDGTGEFVLIRDSRHPDEPLFVVPSTTQFHTKQDFYTYYQKYYDCVRPSAGSVWIIGPAVVEKVAGGWQLREKGMLEVR